MVVQGDASGLTNPQGYLLDKNLVGGLAVKASYKNPRQELGSALNETSRLVGQIPGFAQDARGMSTIALSALDSYDSGVAAIEQTLGGVQSAAATIQTATSGLANIDTSALRAQLDTSAKGLNGLINTLKVLKLAGGDFNVDSLAGTQSSLSSLSSTLSALDNVAANARQAKSAVDNVVAGGQDTLATLKAFDAAGAKASLNDMNGRLEKVQQINVPLVTAQLQYMAAAAPNLKDEDISHTLAIIDKFIAGQVIPGERIQILTTSNVSTDAVAPIVYREAGNSSATLYSTDMGVIEPDARGQLYQVLHEVKAILAGISAIVATSLFLVFDHTAVMAVIRRRRLGNRAKPTGWRAVVARFAALSAAERVYGMTTGAVMLTAMFIIAGGGIPYLPWIGVPAVGAALGLLVAGNAEKISPVAADEVMAGEALGLSFDEVMREIVIPAARPGLLQKLNNRKVKFH
jgi:prefoldin subunit 5